MKKRGLILLAALISVVTVLSACGSAEKSDNGSSNGKSEDTITLKYYNYDGDDTLGYTEALIKAYEAANPQVNIEAVSLVPGNATESLTKLDVLVSSGEQIDIVAFANIEETIARSSKGILASLNDFYAQEGINPEEEYYINPKYNDQYYGMMNTATNWFVYMNKDALDAASLPVPSFEWTWDDFREYAKKLTNGKQYGAYFHGWGEYTNPIAYTDFVNPYIKEDGTPIFNDPSFKYFYDLRRAMEKEDKSAKELADVIGAKLNYRNEFFTGQAAMLMSGSFMLADVGSTEKYPHTFKTVFAPLPRSSSTAEEGYTNIGGQYIAITESSKHKEEAFKFVRYMTTEQDIRIELSGWLKADSKALVERLYGANTELVDLESLNTVIGDERVKTAVSSSITIPYGSQLKKVMEDGFSKYMLDNTTAEEAQAKMMDEAQKIVDRNKK